MKKILLIIFFVLFFCNLNAQIKGVPAEGKCFEIIQRLRSLLKNDTIAVNYFKDYYIVSQHGINNI